VFTRVVYVKFGMLLIAIDSLFSCRIVFLFEKACDRFSNLRLHGFSVQFTMATEAATAALQAIISRVFAVAEHSKLSSASSSVSATSVPAPQESVKATDSEPQVVIPTTRNCKYKYGVAVALVPDFLARAESVMFKLGGVDTFLSGLNADVLIPGLDGADTWVFVVDLFVEHFLDTRQRRTTVLTWNAVNNGCQCVELCHVRQVRPRPARPALSPSAQLAIEKAEAQYVQSQRLLQQRQAQRAEAAPREFSVSSRLREHADAPNQPDCGEAKDAKTPREHKHQSHTSRHSLTARDIGAAVATALNAGFAQWLGPSLKRSHEPEKPPPVDAQKRAKSTSLSRLL